MNYPGCLLGFIMFVLLLMSRRHTIAQTTNEFADSIRKEYGIPELGYAVVSADTVYEMQVMGVKKANTSLPAALSDRFRIGSNTKAVTGFVAAALVMRGKISWDTKFFDLFPELKKGAQKAYHHLTLLDMLTFRGRFVKYTYTWPEPHLGQFTGTESEQRYQFAQWFLSQQAVAGDDSVHFSNLGFVAAGMMLERASGRAYKDLVSYVGNDIGIDFGYGRPNATDSLQTWGHNAALIPEASGDDEKLEWLLAAGNINWTLPDYVKFIQLQLRGLHGQSDLLSKEDFSFLLFGRSRFSMGWFQGTDSILGRYVWNIGNPGTFLTKVYLFPDADRAYILFSNAQTDAADAGINILYDKLTEQYSQ